MLGEIRFLLSHELPLSGNNHAIKKIHWTKTDGWF